MDNAFGDMPHLPAGFKQAAASMQETHTEDWTDPAELVNVARLGGFFGDHKIFI